MKLSDLNVKIFADGSDLDTILKQYSNPFIRGFTTNPTLMAKAGIKDYELFAKSILSQIRYNPVSLEVFADDFDEMERQARLIASWGFNIYVKIPIMNTQKEPTFNTIRKLTMAGIKINVTAIMTLEQVEEACWALDTYRTPSYVSVFAGRAADTGVDPVPLMREARKIVANYPNVELIWASPRELYDIYRAEEVGCHIITVTNDIIKKFPLIEKNLLDYSHETVLMFRDDAVKSGFAL